MRGVLNTDDMYNFSFGTNAKYKIYDPQKYALSNKLMLQLHGAIYRPDSFVLMLRYCANLKAIRYDSTSLNRIGADKSHRVVVALSHNYTSDLSATILFKLVDSYLIAIKFAQ